VANIYSVDGNVFLFTVVMMIRSILLLSLMAAPQSPGTPGVADHAVGPGEMVSGSILLLPEGSHAILVEKATQNLFLFRGTLHDTPELMEVFRANTGEQDGDKQSEGDLRTPEGIYFFTGVINGSELPPEYGLRAFVTDYPNIFDRLAGKHGSNIWLHATDEPERITNGYNTRGCVVVNNEDMNRLTPMIRTGPYTGSTALVVKDHLRRLDPEEAGSFLQEMLKLVADWEAAWESMDIDRFMAFYSWSFSSMGRNYDAFRAYKGRLTRQYEYIKVDISNLHIFRHDGGVVTAFDQRYESDRYRAQSAKRLYFRLEEESWKIVSETSRITPFVPTEREPAEVEIRQLVADWESAWESMDIDRYMAFYGRSFSSRGMDYARYRAYKNQLIERYSYIRVDISNLRVYPREGGMVASFDQRYESDGFRARSSKRLYLELKEGAWKIVKETSEER
jgi:murein L,D-transpeptidase YafK